MAGPLACRSHLGESAVAGVRKFDEPMSYVGGCAWPGLPVRQACPQAHNFFSLPGFILGSIKRCRTVEPSRFHHWLLHLLLSSENPNVELKDFKTTLELEELRFISISDYSYEITKPKISVYGDTAVVAFELNQKGMLVDNKAFTGEHISIEGRATFVLVKLPTWKIVHMHLSRTNG